MKEPDQTPTIADLIPLRCMCCGNAVLRPRLAHEIGASECACNYCPLCDEGGGYEELFYGRRGDNRLLTYLEHMQDTGQAS